jgi:peptidylprolyl isomerase
VPAEPNKNPAGAASSDRAKMMRVLIPAGAIALVVVLVAVIASMTGGGIKMSDGSDGSADDPDLKEIMAGIKYRDLKVGEGTECPPGATVKVNYSGWLVDGTEFDSTRKQGGPTEFKLGAVIQGWQYGIPGMKVGGKRKLVVAPDRGYGARAMGKIPPGSTLIFEVELLGIKEGTSVVTGPGRPMSDGSNGGTDDGGLRTIEGGVKIRDLKEGSGEPCPRGAKVTINYMGWNVKGDVFDSNKNTTFALDGLIAGWKVGIPGMKPGGIRKLVVPAAMAYKNDGRGDEIPPGATLIFEVELLGVK